MKEDQNLQKPSSWFATTATGLEPVLKSELLTHGINGVITKGGVEFIAHLGIGLNICHRLRSPSRIWLRLAKGPCMRVGQIGDIIRSANLKRLLKPQTPLTIKISSKSSRLHRRDIVLQKATRVCKGELQGENPEFRHQFLHLRILDDEGELSIDVAGRLLHKRGWREQQGKASLRENWAANLLLMAGWSPEEPLLDPFCGSGTIPIEAGRMALGLSPHTDLDFAYLDWKVGPNHIASSPAHPWKSSIWGCDKHAPSLAKAQHNATMASVPITFRHLDIAENRAPTTTGLMIANPPYGIRLGKRVEGLYTRWGETISTHFPSWRGIFLSPNRSLAKRVSSNVVQLTAFENGGLRVGVWIWEA